MDGIIEEVKKMGKRVVIIGAVALGPKVAARVKRLDCAAEVTVVDRDSLISYGGCGIPYYVGGDVQEIEGLCMTSANVLRDCTFFKNAKGVDVRTRTEALSIDRKAGTVHVRHLSDNTESDLPYDKLVIATGGMPLIPPLPGIDLAGVSVVSNLHHAQLIKSRLAGGKIDRAVVIGGGAIGLEMAEAVTDLWGVKTTLVEKMDQLLPQAFSPDMSQIIQNHMIAKGVDIRLSESVIRIIGNPETGVQSVETDAGQIPCDLVILAVGVRPNTQLAKEAGLEIGDRGGIVVDEYMRTKDPDIYAGGDCVELTHLISGRKVYMPLGSLANRQGRIIGTNVMGGADRFRGTVGTFCLKVFDFGVARAGLTFSQATECFDPVQTVVVQADRAHFFPTQQPMYLKLIADRGSRRILGIEAMGQQGDAVKARVDAVAAAMSLDATIDTISNLEVAYAPPYASAMDIVNAAANSLDNILAGYQDSIDMEAFLQNFKNGNGRVLDLRSRENAAPLLIKYPGRWLNIPQEELAGRLDEISEDTALNLICGSGARSYEAQRLLRFHGNTHTRNVQGGIGLLKVIDPEIV
ncbi:MAG: FAD-dependent oxidoreductase [Pseudomonadota bacterium]